MKIYDCFTFYNEFELLELRLKALWDVADYFVIVEANRTFTDNPKDFNFPKRADDFKIFHSKIRYVAADLSKVPFKGVGDWSIEIAQRNAIMNGIGDAAADDLIIISDLDEFPAPDVFRRLQENQITLFAPAVIPVTLADKGITCPAQLLVSAAAFLEVGAIVMAQELFYYYFDLRNKGTWNGTILTKRKNLTAPQALRYQRDQLPRIGGGYHFSYMGGVDRVIDKMQSIVDGNELVVKSGGKFIDRKHVEESVNQGEWVFKGAGGTRTILPYDARNIRLPHIEEFFKKYPNFLREPEKYFGENNL